jgi:hypothetical protein
MDRLSSLTDRQLKQIRVLDFCRWMQCCVSAALERDGESALQRFERLWPRSPNLTTVERGYHIHTKALVPSGGTTPPAWGATLAAAELGHAFAEFIQPTTLIGRIDRLRHVPFGISVSRSTTELTGYWAGGGRPKPVSAGTFDGVILRPAVASGMAILSRELFRFSAPGSTEFIRDELGAGVTSFLDRQFIDPANTGVPDVNPAAITAGVAASHTSTGDVVEDLRELVSGYVAAGGSLASAVILLSSQNASALAIRSGVTGSPQFPGLTASGGVLAGVPAVASDSVGTQLVMVDARGIIIADDLGLDFSISQAASIEMLDNPTNNSTTPTATTMVSLYMTNSVSLKIERFVNWQRLGAISIVDSVDYLTEGSPA